MIDSYPVLSSLACTQHNHLPDMIDGKTMPGLHVHNKPHVCFNGCQSLHVCQSSHI